ncbi:MAG: response receiver sensor histidine kinase [Deltaproteobacteria bacterium]|nr:response receiver sensor histidine kinase [Deltaproteobacteria bacterium]
MRRIVTVLICDDCKDDAERIWRALSSEGYDVVYQMVSTPEAMRAALEHQEWDIVTSELYMPLFSASEALGLARKLRPQLPFIIVSDENALTLTVALMKNGADDCIQKSALARLVPAVARVLREVETRRESKRLEAELRTSEMRYRRLFETAKDGILLLNADTGAVTDVNPFLLEMLGFAAADIVGKKLWEIGLFVDREACRHDFRELQQNGYIRYEDLPLQKRNGQLFDVEYVSNLYLVEGEKVIQCNVRDITARKEAEAQYRILDVFLSKRAVELEAANSELEAFSYTVSHDLRSPLMTINGYCQVIREQCSQSMGRDCLEYFEEIYSGTMRMKELIDTLLEFALLSHRKLVPVPVDLTGMVNSLAAELSLTSPRRQVEFTVATKVMATGDVKLLRIALANLLQNAWKYTKKTAEAVIEFGCTEDGTVPTCFVRDNGAGFDMAKADNLFAAFNRMDGAEAYEGMGIGLSTVKRIIERHGGKVWGEGVVGKGATFFFTLPAPG